MTIIEPNSAGWGRGVLLRSQSRPYHKGAEPQRYPISGSLLFYLCVHPLTKNDQIRRGNTQGEGLVFRGSSTPWSQGAEPSAPQLWRFSIYAYALSRRMTTFDKVSQVGRGVFLGVEHATHPKGRNSSAPQYWVPLYLHLHPST